MKKIKHIHFIGSKGVSMAALMDIAKGQGSVVSGSDILHFGHSADNIHKHLDLVVYSAAVGEGNVELIRARELGIKLMTRGQFLGEVMENFDISIAIGGAHGKTTTTAMMNEVLRELEPKVHIGAGESQFRIINSESGIKGGLNKKNTDCKNHSPITKIQAPTIFITEACEYKKSFLELKHDIAIVLNTDLDHTDCYQNLDEAKQAFYEFADNAKKIAIVGDDFNDCKLLNAKRIIKAGLKIDCDIRAGVLRRDKNGHYNYCLFIKNKLKGRIYLKVAGRHNVVNSLFVIAAALELGLSLEQVRKGLGRFNGIGRRFERLGEADGNVIYSDYAHHPKEIDCTIASMRECGYEHIFICFEPHTYTRTASFYKEFALSLSKADEVVLLPIFAAREQKTDGISSKSIESELKKAGFAAVICADDYMNACEYVRKYIFRTGQKNANINNSAIVFIGAGTIDGIAREFVDNFSN